MLHTSPRPRDRGTWDWGVFVTLCCSSSVHFALITSPPPPTPRPLPLVDAYDPLHVYRIGLEMNLTTGDNRRLNDASIIEVPAVRIADVLRAQVSDYNGVLKSGAG